MEQGAAIVWFKRDLRWEDHGPLAEAARRFKRVIPVFLMEPGLQAQPDFDALHGRFISECLDELDAALRARGSRLVVLQDEAVEALQWLHEQTQCTHLFSHEETGNAFTYGRDKAVARWARARGICWEAFWQNGVVRALKHRDGWARIWHQRMGAPLALVPSALPAVPSSLPGWNAGTSKLLFPLPAFRQGVATGGRRAGLATLASFLRERGGHYHREMSSPLTAETACSRLSSYLAYGGLSMREIVQAAQARKKALQTEPEATFTVRALTSFLSRCHWHCHFMQKLESEPAIEHRCFNRACDALRPRPGNREDLKRFRDGRTGYPFLDACIRFLVTRGWINFRMRAMLTSFAAYNLWLDWRDFKDWLACQFQDYEPGIHISQIQMQSGVTGINTLRIYNVVKQGHDQDPSGAFIRQWVPELAHVPESFIHEPWNMSALQQEASQCRFGHDYPHPVIDLAESVKRARSAFALVRKEDFFWEEVRRVQEKHGSRKSRETRPELKRAPTKDEATCAQTEFML